MLITMIKNFLLSTAACFAFIYHADCAATPYPHKNYTATVRPSSLPSPYHYPIPNTQSQFESSTAGSFSQTNLPGPYSGLLYSTFIPGPFNYAEGFCYNICPHSYPYTTAFGYGQTSSPGASISVVYPSSHVLCIDLFSFYFGCTALQNTTAPDGETFGPYDLPANCTMTVKGYAQGPTTPAMPGADVVPDLVATFEYVPNVQDAPETGFSSAAMMHAVLPSGFDGFQTITFNATTSKRYASAPAVFVDDLAYRIYNSSTPKYL